MAMNPGPRKMAAPVLALLCGYLSVCSGSEPYCPADLTRMSWTDLECVYRKAEPGRVPNGFARGHVAYCPDAFLSRTKSAAGQLLWQGKHFDAEVGTLINQWRGLQAIRGTVYHGTSWLDGKPAIILDYSETSRVWSDVRDEMREVSPGVFLGAMFLRRCPEPRLKLYFVLQSCE
jgi:hypothetical protein